MKEESGYSFYNHERKKNDKLVSSFMKKISITRKRERFKKNAKVHR